MAQNTTASYSNTEARVTQKRFWLKEKRVEKFSIHALPAGDRERYADEWAGVQRRFVDDPSMAVIEADRLVTKS